MGKRVAEKQLTDRDSQENGEEEEEQTTIQKVAPTNRVIRGMPARKAATPVSAIPTPVNSFAGFGAAAASTFPSTISTPSLPTSAFSFTPVIAPTPSSSSNSAVAGSSKMDFSFTSTATPPSPIETYYRALRGLNVSLLADLNKKVTEDPFLNFGDEDGVLDLLRKNYEGQRKIIQMAYATTQAPKVMAWSGPPMGVVAAKIEKPKPVMSMPTPPTSFKFGDSAPVASQPVDSTKPAPVGFTPTPTTSNSGFTFPKSSVTPTPIVPLIPKPVQVIPAVIPARFAPTAPSPLRFDGATTTEKKVGFSFGGSFGAIANPPPPVVAAPASAFESISAPQGPSTPKDSTFPAFNAPPATTPSLTRNFANPITGSPPITTFGSGTSSFDFGAGLKNNAVKAPVVNAGFGFGMGSTATPVAPIASFSFGNSPPKNAGFGSANPFGSNSISAAGFSFGSTPTLPSPPSVVSSLEATPAPEAINEEVFVEGAKPSNPLIGTGAGEEGEVVLYESRGKVYVIEGVESKDLGLAIVLIKELDGIKRILARNTTNGQVLINFRLSNSLSIKLEKSFITFGGYKGTASAIYRIKSKTVEVAEALKSALEKAAGVI